MSPASFRNRLGDLVEVPVVSATRMKNEFGALFDKVARGGAVAISRHDTPKAVLISFEEFSELAKLRASALDDLSGEFDAMLARMQEPAVRTANAAAFDATPEAMGAAAVRAARGAGLPDASPARRPTAAKRAINRKGAALAV